MRGRLAGAFVAAMALLSLSLPEPSAAQAGLADLVPRRDLTDERGVEVNSAIYRHRETLLQIGSGERPLDLSLDVTSPGLAQMPGCYGHGDIGNAIYLALSSNAYYGAISGASALHTAVLPHQSGRFNVYTSSGGQLPYIVQPYDARYVTGTYDYSNWTFNYIGSDGTEATYSTLHTPRFDSWSVGSIMNVEEVRYPNGEIWTYRYNDATVAQGACPYPGRVSRIRSIVSSRGYGLQFDYALDPIGPITTQSAAQDFISIVLVTAYNRAITFCDEAQLQSCPAVTALGGAVTFSYDRANSRVTITKPNGETTELTFGWALDARAITNVTRPGGVTRSMVAYAYVDSDYGTISRTLSLTEAERTWFYSSAPALPVTNQGEATNEDPAGQITRYVIDPLGYLMAMFDPLERETGLAFDSVARLTYQRSPEGEEFAAGYDGRGNLNLILNIPRAGSGLTTLQASATYPSSCSSTDRRSCNQPLTQTDRNGNTTTFTYDPAHSGVLTQTGPAVNGVAPQMRHEYAQRTAWVLDGAGGYVAAAPIWVRTATSTCQSSAATGNPAAPCATPGDEIRTTYDYGPDSGPNNLLLRGVVVNGPGVSNSRTCYGYDVQGQRISETGPGAGLTSCP